MLFVFILLQGTKTEAEVILKDQTVEITGQYGKVYNLSDISEVRLADTIPAIGRKANGAGLGDIKKGIWEVEGMGQCRLFIEAAGGPYILLTTSQENVIINFKDAQKTQDLYQTLLKAIAQ
jgi:hypothetical protein